MTHSKLVDSLASNLSADELMPMPASHVTKAKWFERIVNEGALIPTDCKIFGRKILYLFYGGVFYRPENKTTRDSLDLPVGFLFRPRVLENAKEYYPFDTGGVRVDKFPGWRARFEPIEERFAVPGEGS